MLLRSVYLSLDPYMRGRMSDAPSYAPPVAVGEVMIGQTVSVVVASRHPDFRQGDRVLANSGWQEYELCDGSRSLSKLSAGHRAALVRARRARHAGLHGVRRIARYRQAPAGRDAGGRRGHRSGGLGRRPDREIQGCRVVGIAGGADKCAWAVHELGFDDCIDHRSAALDAQLAAACPGGIDIYYENVGGKVFRAVLPLLNAHARIPVCGLISQYNETPAQSPGDSVRSSCARSW